MTSHRTMIRNLLPGIVLPGLAYLAASRFTSVLVALVVASSVPLLDTAVRLSRGRAPSPASVGFVAFTLVSIGLALWLRSPLLLLLKGAAISAVLGLAFALSAALRRPLTRTLALYFSTEHREERRHLAERWRHPRALRVFRVLSIGWGLWLLLSATEQTVLALNVSPGTVMAVDPGIHAVATVVGVAVSVLYVRRRQRVHPELGMLPLRAS